MGFEVEGQDAALGCEMIMRPAGAMTNVAYPWRKRYNWTSECPRGQLPANRTLVGLILGICRWYLHLSVIRSPRGHPRVVPHKSGLAEFLHLRCVNVQQEGLAARRPESISIWTTSSRSVTFELNLRRIHLQVCCAPHP